MYEIKSYEYFEGDFMYKYINSIIMNIFETKRYQILNSNDKIEEIIEEISDLYNFDKNSRLF